MHLPNSCTNLPICSTNHCEHCRCICSQSNDEPDICLLTLQPTSSRVRGTRRPATSWQSGVNASPCRRFPSARRRVACWYVHAAGTAGRSGDTLAIPAPLLSSCTPLSPPRLDRSRTLCDLTLSNGRHTRALVGIISELWWSSRRINAPVQQDERSVATNADS
jgi:hypothetical protein